MIGIKLELGVAWKNGEKLMIWSMYLDLKCSVMF